MRIALSLRWRRVGLTVVVLGILLTVAWNGFLGRPQYWLTPEWLVVVSEPVLAWQTNAVDTCWPTVEVQVSNCGPRGVEATMSGYCLWFVVPGTSSGSTTGLGGYLSMPSTASVHLEPRGTASLVHDLTSLSQITNRGAELHQVQLLISWREAPKPFQRLRNQLGRVEAKLLEEGLIDTPWSWTFRGLTNVHLRCLEELQRLLEPQDSD